MTGLQLVPGFGGTYKPLPVAWDGVPVTWSEEALPVGHVFICPPPKVPAACPKCGVLRSEGADQYVGRLPVDQPAYWDRHPKTGQTRKHPARTVDMVRLFLTRCLACSHDQVYDWDKHELWDLDETDYGDEGSWVREQTLF